ncbi:LexA family protein [Comamonas sp. GB3 AK4-5]|uniref:LexA family protein n=1 Tax=Comamonas sp. GB3 AK4-5 TaxID=3231487 RepID=UPI00351E75EE
MLDRPTKAPSSIHMDLAKELVRHPLRTFIQRATGDSMEDAGIFDGDLLVVDRYLAPLHGDIVIARVDGEFTCKRYSCSDGLFALQAENPAYPSIHLGAGQDIEIWGVVTNSVRRFRQT